MYRVAWPAPIRSATPTRPLRTQVERNRADVSGMVEKGALVAAWTSD